jgi:predicted metal-binding membrane protein
MIRARALSRRGAAWIGFFGATLLAWAGLHATVVSSGLDGMPPGIWAALCAGAAEASFLALGAMWGLMVAAMMLPTFAPTFGTFIDLVHAGAARHRDAVALVAGYLGVWGGAALIGAVLQAGLARAGLVAPDGSSLSLWFTAGLCLAAGLYQFSVFKAACLAKCRMPLGFFMERWRPGPVRAAAMGAELGLACLGCCWALMALAFVGGTMNLLWMGAAMIFMAAEKMPAIGRLLTRPAGWGLLAGGAVAALAAATAG